MKLMLKAGFRALVVWSLSGSLAGVATAQVPGSQVPYERVLVPIVLNGAVLGGAYGAAWNSTLMVRVDADEPVLIAQLPGALSVAGPSIAGPKSTIKPLLLFTPDPNAGAFVYVGAPGAGGKVTFLLRVQDLSRSALNWGTVIPVVRERDVFSSRAILLDVPADPRFRVALRVYDFDPAEDRQIRVRFYELSSNTVLAETVLVLTAAPQLQPPVDPKIYPAYPGAARITDVVSSFPQLNAVKEFRVELEPVTPGLRFWPLITVTNNETQHVTAITAR